MPKAISAGFNSVLPFYVLICTLALARDDDLLGYQGMLISLAKCKNMSFENNIFVSDESVRFAHNNGIALLKNNLFDVPKGQVFKSKNSWDKSVVKLTLNKSNKITRSMLKVNGSKVLLKKESPALLMGIKPLNYSKVGLFISKPKNIHSTEN